MTKLLMMIVLVCMIPAAAVFGQENNNAAPKDGGTREHFRSTFEWTRVTEFYPLTHVCTAADLPRPGERGMGGPCVDNFRRGIPINNSPAWDCEQVKGVGN